MKMFAQLSKVDEEKRLVFGRATQQQLDRAGEMFDYATSKPHFEKWSSDLNAATKAASGQENFGNVRAMHGAVAAGKLAEISFLDDEKAIDVVAKVVDDNEWKKVLSGVYSGFSIGGSYEKKWDAVEDGKTVKMYTAIPAEISLVDLPCLPSAKFFEVRKADGAVENVEFVPQKMLKVYVSGADTSVEIAESDAVIGKTVSYVEKDAEQTMMISKIADGIAYGFPVRDGQPEPEVAGSEADVLKLAQFLNDNGLTVKDALTHLEKACAPGDKKEMAKEDNAAADDAKEEADESPSEDTPKEEEAEKAAEKIAKVEAPDELAKALKVLVDEQAGMLKTLRDDLEKIRKQPEAPRVALRAVEKGGESFMKSEPADVTPVMIGGKENEVATLIKAEMAKGGVPLSFGKRAP